MGGFSVPEKQMIFLFLESSGAIAFTLGTGGVMAIGILSIIMLLDTMVMVKFSFCVYEKQASTCLYICTGQRIRIKVNDSS